MELTTQSNKNISAMLSFSWIIFKANARNFGILALNIGTPVSIIGLYLITGMGLPPQVVPMLFVLSITFNGSTLGARLITWRENQLFHRLSVTPTPMFHIITGLFLAQVVLSIAQALVALIVIALAGVTLTPANIVICLYTILISCFCFTALGPFVASFVNRAELVLYIYVFFIMPLGFVSYFTQYGSGDGIVSQIVSLLPMRMMSNLFATVSTPVELQTFIISSVGLIGYGVLFLFIAGKRYRHFLS